MPQRRRGAKNVAEPIVFLLLLGGFLVSSVSTIAQQAGVVLEGRIVDPLGSVIVGAVVKVTGASGGKTSVTRADGSYAINSLTPGRYTVSVEAPGFARYEQVDVNLAAGRRRLPDIQLTVTLKTETLTITEQKSLSTDPDNNASALVLRGADLDVLSDDPDQLAEDLRAIAGPADGPNGAQFFVDGFSGGRLPSKASIKEVRINANPFAADQDSFGLGRIEIITRAGTDKLRGTGFVTFNDESLNARDPFALRRSPFQARLYGASVSGPLIAKKASIFFDFERRDIDENANIVAVILDSSFNPVSFRQTIQTPQRRTVISGRLDYQLHPNHTLVARYSHFWQTLDNAGVGGVALASTAYNTSRAEDTFQVTETAIVSPSALNETRFQFNRVRRELTGDNTVPGLVVQDAFRGGGSQVGQALLTVNSYELQNTTIRTSDFHTWKIGGRLRGEWLTDIAPNNFGGTYIFSSLDQLSDVLLAVPGATPAQFTLAAGNPETGISQTDLAAFVMDDWRIRDNVTLSYGLRIEAQTNLNIAPKFAPRVAVAWAPGSTAATKRPLTVIRAGFGMYYYRVGNSLFRDERRFNGVTQQQFIVNNPSFFPNIPTPAQLGAAVPQTVRRVQPGISTPYGYYAAFSVERQLPRNTIISATYIHEIYRQLLRSRNINAPLPGTYDPSIPSSGVRPFGNTGNIFQFESGGVGIDRTLFINLRSQFSKRVNIFGGLAFSREQNNADGAYGFPANSYDLSREYAQAQSDPHVFGNAGATITGPWAITFSPLVRANSSTAFNITTGVDANGDGVFSDRPSFATDLSRPGVVITSFGAFQTAPASGDLLIPRNYGRNPSFFNVNLRVARTFKLGSAKGGQGGRAAEPFTLTVAIVGQNIFNHTNPAQRIGNLRSPLFGQPIATLGIPRRVDLSLRLNF